MQCSYQARIIDGRTLSTVDTTIMWKQMCKTNLWMNFSCWLKFIEEISEARRFVEQSRGKIYFNNTLLDWISTM